MKIQILLLLMLLCTGEAFSQQNLGFRWVREVPPDAFPFQSGVFNAVAKRGHQICFTDNYMMDPLEVRPNGMMIPVPEDAFGFIWIWCGNSGSQFATGLQFSAIGESVRQHYWHPGLGPIWWTDPPDLSGLTFYRGDYNFNFRSIADR